MEILTLDETGRGVEIAGKKHRRITPLVTFGWDTRPLKNTEWWALRMNLKNAPLLKLRRMKKSLSLQHLEFNFIQLVNTAKAGKIQGLSPFWGLDPSQGKEPAGSLRGCPSAGARVVTMACKGISVSYRCVSPR